MNLVPSTGAGVKASVEFELVQVSKDGLHFYVHRLSRDVGDAIVIGTRDFTFLCGQGEGQYLLVLIRNGKILRGEPKPYGDLEKADVIEVTEFLSRPEGRAPDDADGSQ